MRNAFANEMTLLAVRDPRVVLLSGDIGNRLFNDYKASFPDRFYNCGVAEQNMIGVAAGLAMGGLRPVVYTIAPFTTYRCLEQIRVDACYHDLPVTIVGVGAGLSYASLGGTHHSCEDIACLRSLPNMRVVCPGDAMEVRGGLRAALAQDHPVYMRIGKKNEPVVHADVPRMELGRCLPVPVVSASEVDGEFDVMVLSTGTMLPSARDAVPLLRERGINARLESWHTVKPLDEAALSSAFQRAKVVATIEEHSLIGGLGSAVAEWLVDQQAKRARGDALSARLLRLGTPDAFQHLCGSQGFLREQLGLTALGIAEAIQRAIETDLIVADNPRMAIDSLLNRGSDEPARQHAI